MELLPLVWPLPRSLATTCGISVDFFSSPYLDVSVQAVPLIYLWIQYMMTVHYHRRIAPFGNPRILAPICGSPWLIAACHVLLRLPVPRHSPCALSSLTILYLVSFIWFSQFFGKNCSNLPLKINPFRSIKKQLLNLPLSQFLCSIFKVQFLLHTIRQPRSPRLGGLKWTRTTDLTLIRRAL